MIASPQSLNIPGAPYPCVHADRSVTLRVAAPDAQKVQVPYGRAARHDSGAGRPVDGDYATAGCRVSLLQRSWSMAR